MARIEKDKEIRKLLSDRDRLAKDSPELGTSYKQFLRDWQKYRKDSKQIKEANDYLIFGASFRE